MPIHVELGSMKIVTVFTGLIMLLVLLSIWGAPGLLLSLINRQSFPGDSRLCCITPPSYSQWEYRPNKKYIIGITTFMKPLAVLGALSICPCIWLIWCSRRIFFSDHMYATNRDLADGVSIVTNNMLHLSADVSATEEHLTQRIEKVEEKLDRQKETDQSLKDQVTEFHGTVRDLDQVMEATKVSLQKIKEKMDSMNEKQVDFCVRLEYVAQRILLLKESRTA